jgi:signal transduction histidine kinase
MPAWPQLMPFLRRPGALALAGGGHPLQDRAMLLHQRLFAYTLLMRPPLAGEEEDINAACAWIRRRWLLLCAGYVTVLWLTVRPAFADGHDLHYRTVALVGAHLLIWMVASTVAGSLVGFRPCRDWFASLGAVQAIALGMLLLAVSLLVYADAYWERASHRWIEDTFGSAWLFGAAMFVVYGVPELVARLRRRERAAVTRALAAEAASERLARKTAESELRLLQAQVEPHFLYNTLANLRYLIQKNSPDALRMTDALIEYLRTSVPDMRALRVTLGREVDHAGHFLEIMQMRMGSRLTFTLDVPQRLRDVEVPPLMLLTLVENAVKHGIAPQVEGGAVALRARDDGALIEIEVTDTGAGVRGADARTCEVPSTGVGLENLRGRLQLAYGEQVAVTLTPNAPRGTRVQLRIPREMPHGEVALHAAQIRVMTAEAARSAGLLVQETAGSGV